LVPKTESSLNSMMDVDSTLIGESSSSLLDGKEETTSTSSASTESTTMTMNTSHPFDDYIATMKPLQIGEMSLASSHVYARDQTVPPTSTILRLAQELSVLSTALPLSPSGSIFVRWDSERINLLRAMITGPADTPYEHGCFIFDIFVPPHYPNVPPQVTLLTTGNGTVRFNPNLYSSGRICVSLLGTWSGNESENWMPRKSTLLQVLMSIQSLVMCSEPYFNEPGYEARKDSPDAQERSRMLNERLIKETKRHAILHYLSYIPTTDFDHIARTHFSIMKPHLEPIDNNVFNWMKDIARTECPRFEV